MVACQACKVRPEQGSDGSEMVLELFRGVLEKETLETKEDWRDWRDWLSAPQPTIRLAFSTSLLASLAAHHAGWVVCANNATLGTGRVASNSLSQSVCVPSLASVHGAVKPCTTLYLVYAVPHTLLPRRASLFMPAPFPPKHSR